MFDETLAAGQAGHRDPIHNDIARALNAAGENVRLSSYGAAGNDTQDDTAEIQAAIAAAPAFGTVILPPLTSGQAVYRTSAALTVTKPLRIIGYGAKVKNVGTGNVLDISSVTTGPVVVEGLGFDGNFPTRTSGRLLTFSGCTAGVRVQHCDLRNAGGVALALSNCNEVRILDNHVENINATGIMYGESASTIRDCWIERNRVVNTNQLNNAGHSAIMTLAQVTENARIWIRQNSIATTLRAGITAEVNTGLWISDNWITDCGGEGIAAGGWRQKITGNEISDCPNAGAILFWMRNPTGGTARPGNGYSIVSGNQCEGSGQGLAIVWGENDKTLDRLLVQNNIFTGNSYAIQAYIFGGATGSAVAETWLAGNILAGNTNDVSLALASDFLVGPNLEDRPSLGLTSRAFGTGLAQGGAWDRWAWRNGTNRFWTDSTGDLRVKNGIPTSDTDGTVVGTQS